MPGEEPAQEKDDGGLHDQLEQAVADQVAGAEAQDPEQREHEERVDQVGQRLG